MAIVVHGEPFESYSAALDEYIRVHIGGHENSSESCTGRSDRPEILLANSSRRFPAKINHQTTSAGHMMSVHVHATPQTAAQELGVMSAGQLARDSPSVLEDSLPTGRTSSASEDLCHCSAPYGFQSPSGQFSSLSTQLHIDDKAVDCLKKSTTVTSAVDRESVCTEELLHADWQGNIGARQPVLSYRHNGRPFVSDLVHQHCCMQRAGMLDLSGGTRDINRRSQSSDSMETLKRVLFDMQQLASEFQYINETAGSENSDH